MRPEHFTRTTLKTRVPRGPDGFWEIILKLDASQGEFTIPDIDGESNANIRPIRQYVMQLVAGGYLAIVRAAHRNNGQQVGHVFRVVKRQVLTPRFRQDGTPVHASMQAHIWTAIRTLKTFTLADVVFAARTDDVAPSREAARKYIRRLQMAGYLALVNAETIASRSTWRLKPAMDTGPQAPEARRIETVALWDPNTQKFVPDDVVASEVLR
ncbi:hypothetical protein X566_15495 [Afipia sp. P52-10]|uniref:hypothetical protein n=1 Tax=Afipia sp. P52-10 TaxID=1429916 RepID=UPI0003DEF604|nr:hypothetical protein [Afipia sp. P52-10]ETR78890.1 hypothetical protein X566_15495 [Afipia sp. P52-10]